MSRKKQKQKGRQVRGTRQGKQLSEVEKALIPQVYLVTGSKKLTAEHLGLAESTVYKHLARYVEGTGDKNLQAARARSAAEIAGRLHQKTSQLIDSIKPEDFRSGRIPKKDKDGNLIGYHEYGPSLMQKVTASAIMIDKLPVLQGYEAALQDDHDHGKLPLPSDVEALMRGIKNKVKSLTFLNVNFEQENQDLSQRVQDRIAEAEVARAVVVEPKVITLDDFDNPNS